MFFNTLFIFMSFFAGAKAVVTKHVHVYKEGPFFLFEIDEPKLWKIQAVKPSIVRFNPSDNIKTRFEVAPSINIIPTTRVDEADIVIKDKEEGENPQGVHYKAVFLKGWESRAYLMSFGNMSVYVADGVWEHPEYDLSGKNILLQMRDSFTFLDPTKLKDTEIRKVIIASSLQKMLMDHERQQNKVAELSVSSQMDKYVVSFKGMRGGPIFHIAKKNLEVKLYTGQ